MLPSLGALEHIPGIPDSEYHALASRRSRSAVELFLYSTRLGCRPPPRRENESIETLFSRRPFQD